MIVVTIHSNSADRITYLRVADHAGSTEETYDMICAAASTLIQTAIGALGDLCELQESCRIVSDDDGESVPFSEITIPAALANEENIRTAQVILQTVRIGFRQLEETDREEYGGQHIKIEEKHVGGVCND